MTEPIPARYIHLACADCGAGLYVDALILEQAVVTEHPADMPSCTRCHGRNWLRADPAPAPAMTLNDYQATAHRTAVYPPEVGMDYTALGLNAEAGEYGNLVKKMLRGDHGSLDLLKPTAWPFDLRAWLMGELGDVLWYVAECATLCGFSLEEVAKHNVEKLGYRRARGVLKGSGGER